MTKNIFLKTAIKAAKQAEKIILDYYKNGAKIEYKADKTPVTIADKEAEKIIIKTIKQQFPDHNFLGEEFGSNQNGSQYTWVIDPIDGTKNFIRKIDDRFGTLIALMKGDEIIVGVSNLPTKQEMIYAQKGCGAYLNNSKTKLKISTISQLDKAYASFGTLKYFARRSKLNQLNQLSESVHASRGFGDCWSYHLISKAKIDIMLEGKINIWDIAPATIIITEAGGKCTDLYGGKITNKTETFLASNGKLHQQVIDIFNK
jgi:histidinol-phosphatase